MIAGTPAVTGTFPFKLAVTDTRGVTANVDLTIEVYPKLALATTRLAPARVGRSYRATVRASGSVSPSRSSFALAVCRSGYVSTQRPVC